MPTTSPATGAWRGRPGRRSTSTSSPASTTPTRRSPTAGGSISDRSRSRRSTLPGHRPEHTAFLVSDGGRGDEPIALLCGDSLFVGDVARPDLAIEPRDGAAALYHSLNDRLFDLPEQRRGLARAPRRLDVRQRRHRPQDLLDDRVRARAQPGALRFGSEAEFVADAVASLGDRPPNAERVVALNRGPFIGGARRPDPALTAGGRGRDRRGRDPRRRPDHRPVRRGAHPRARSAPPPTTPASRPRSPRWCPPTSS